MVQQQLGNETGLRLPDINGRIVIRRLDELHPHPSYSWHDLAVSASQLSALAALNDQTLEAPIAITRTGVIIDGYARVERALRKFTSSGLPGSMGTMASLTSCRSTAKYRGPAWTM